MRRPNLFLCGAPKAGSTSLHDYLDQHPDIFMSPVKEPNHFASDLNITGEDWRVHRRENYAALFKDARDQTVVGESSIFYSFSRAAIPAAEQFSPGAKYIYLMRNPVDAVWSLHWQFVKTSNENKTRLADALDAEPARAEGRELPPSVHNPAGLLYTRVYDYAQHLQHVRDAASPERVHVELFEDLARDPAAVYARVLRFLGVDDAFRANFDIKNPARPVRNLPLRRFAADKPLVKKTFVNLPAPIRGTISKAAQLLIKDKTNRDTLEPAVARRLVDFYEPKLPRLEEMLNRDLTVWRERWNKHLAEAT